MKKGRLHHHHRPVPKEIENGINRSVVSGFVKYPDEENYTEIKVEENEDEEDDSVIPDSEYKLFLEHLRPDGKSYALVIPEANVYVKYEPSSPEHVAPTIFPIENENYVSNTATMDTEMHAPAKYKGKLHTDRSANGGCNHVASEAQNCAENHTGEHNGWEQSGGELSADKNLNGSASNNYVASKPQSRAPSYSGKRRGRKPKGLSKPQATENPNGDSNQVVTEANRHDRSEAHKHEHADRRRSNRVKKNDVPSVKGKKIGEGVKTESDDDVLHIRTFVHCPVLNVRFLCGDNDEANARKCTKYREKLMEELKKPYCQEEYERLFKDITVRKQAQGQRVLRGRTTTYDEGHVSKSYLDCHIDLKRKIHTAPDDYPKVLNLMRGFFYWLVNISHEGVFRPWRVQSYLDELLQH
ncbi:hypothetical protein TanjilG_19579 [Lupinus angustifolius]|uniref:Uncharacterized protein n=1 Tax=Lupinus angustifolius TaxID=3871 RepID=A0A1J7H3W7_LUPAN|nr:hypothetical protein TanjilG_19579 [Lupinus angustifolius]